MRILIVGLGSMGKRRIRNLKALGVENLGGYDIRADRRLEVEQEYKLPTFDAVEKAISEFQPTTLVISTPPLDHMYYAALAFDKGLDFFIEASVVEGEKIHNLARMLRASQVIGVPSCTMKYFQGPKLVKALLGAGTIGRPLSFTYEVGQYLPDWHPWESINDFYVSRRETGGAREIVPFELTWLNSLFGKPAPLYCIKTKLSEMGADIDDYYQIALEYPGRIFAAITVQVLSRPVPTRELRILGSDGIITFGGERQLVKSITKDGSQWIDHELTDNTIESGYKYPEEPYIREMHDFVQAVKKRDRNLFPNNFDDDYEILKLLNDLEGLSCGL